jgi:acetoacetyl-CoA reductase
MMNTSLAGRVAFVTSGTNPLGTAICKDLARSGAKVVTHCSNERTRNAWTKQLADDGVTVTVYKNDITSFASCQEMIAAVEQEHGPVNIVVNNPAEEGAEVPFRSMTKGQWDQTLATNLDPVFNITRQVVQGMNDRGFGRIINISSLAALRGEKGSTSFAAATAGIHGFTLALSQEVARKGITVNTVTPGHVDAGKAPADSASTKQLLAQIPAGRLGTTEEVAFAVHFLASDAASYITGIDLPVTGGHHIA